MAYWVVCMWFKTIIPQCWLNVGPPSTTLAQQKANTGSLPRACCDIIKIVIISIAPYRDNPPMTIIFAQLFISLKSDNPRISPVAWPDQQAWLIRGSRVTVWAITKQNPQKCAFVCAVRPRFPVIANKLSPVTRTRLSREIRRIAVFCEAKLQ